MNIRPASPDDASAIADIYNYYITNTIITFEEIEVDATEIGSRIQAIQTQFPYLVYELDNRILGYAYATAFRPRSAYRFSVESTVYLDQTKGGKGFGTELYSALINELRSRQFHCAIGGIALPNAASVALHEKLGFNKIAHLTEVGRKFDRWVDVGYWQLPL